MTAANGRPIDFFIVGSPKCGTTTLHDVLRQHPDVFLPRTKDKAFFVDAVPHFIGETEVPAYYREYNGERLIGCSEANLMFFASGFDLVRRHNPAAKLIAILRDPVDRAYSAYWYGRRNTIEDSETFEIAIDRELERAQGDYRAQANLTHLAHGRYADQLAAIRERFPPEQLHVMFFEELKSDPRGAIYPLLEWIGADPEVQLDVHRASNGASMPRLKLVQRVLIAPPVWSRHLYHAVVPERLKEPLWNGVRGLIRRNLAPFRYPPMAPETRARLAAYFAPHNRRLADMVGRPLPGWTMPDQMPQTSPGTTSAAAVALPDG